MSLDLMNIVMKKKDESAAAVSYVFEVDSTLIKDGKAISIPKTGSFTFKKEERNFLKAFILNNDTDSIFFGNEIFLQKVLIAMAKCQKNNDYPPLIQIACG